MTVSTQKETMKKLSSFVLAAILFIGTLLSLTPNALAQTATNTVTIVSTAPKVAAGTTHGATKWEEYHDFPDGGHGVIVFVDTSAAQFQNVPMYLVSFGVDEYHLPVTGSSSIYFPTAKGFVLLLRWDSDLYKELYARDPKGHNWYINWIGIEASSGQGTAQSSSTTTTCSTGTKIASGRTQPGATNWRTIDGGIKVYIDTSDARFSTTPVYTTSIGGDENGYQWATTGSSSIYNATDKGFNVSIRWDKGFSDTLKLEQIAKDKKWYINWTGIEPGIGYLSATCPQTGSSTASAQTPSTTAQAPLPTLGKNYYLTNKKSGKVVDVEGGSTADGANIQQYAPIADVDQQRWTLEDAGDGYYYLVSKKSNKVVGVAGGATGNTADAANAIQWTKTASANDQKWKLEDAGDGYFFLVNKNSGKVLEVAGGSLVDKGNLQQYTKNQTDAQKWKFEDERSTTNPQ